MSAASELENYGRCLSRKMLHESDFSMSNGIAARVIRGGTVQTEVVTVVYKPTLVSRSYRSTFSESWVCQFERDLNDGRFY
ncbi:hypothetical protein [Azospirillum canadense]|uniref:hypothetical protein n=1 Tax=Azospirillum canadense TaxID=403962 RepID=UPI002227E2CF|nr:hypothetical protein [Azospirillum canadense]MCW2239136.1 hypothetical protein [Azospirillum canadense]